MTANTMTRSKMDNGLLDRYMLPRVALVTIGVASLVGTYLTMTIHGAPAVWAIVRWLHLVALGVLVGGTMWWGWFVRRPDLVEETADVARFSVAQQARFRAIALGALIVGVLTLPHLLWFAGWANNPFDQMLLFANAATLVVALALVGWLVTHPQSEERAYENRFTRVTWGALVLAIVLTAFLDAHLTFPNQPFAWLLRSLHMLAFTSWIGGAVWNIFIAVPGAQATLSIGTVVAAAQQLERFRWTVRFILPTLFITGLLQAYPYIGLNLDALLFSFFGQLILVKIGLVAALIVIFFTCPMWRACSPIKGMCDLDDLNAPKAPAPSQRLDNRGKACAGFVKIQKMLQGMQPGDVLELLSSDRISWWELPAWVEKNGYHLVAKEKNGRWLWQWYRFMIQKNAAESAQQ